MSRKKAPSRLLTDAVREVRNTRSRFLSLLVLSALAVCFLAGLRATAPDMKETGDLYFDQQRLMDLRVVSTLGLTEEDVELLARQEGVEEAEGAYTIDAAAVSYTHLDVYKRQVSTVVMYSPLRRMETRSEISSTSLSLWVMMMMAWPSAFMRRSTSKSLAVSWTVRTAVGSSRMMTLAP